MEDLLLCLRQPVASQCISLVIGKFAVTLESPNEALHHFQLCASPAFVRALDLPLHYKGGQMRRDWKRVEAGNNELCLGDELNNWYQLKLQ